MNSNVNRRTALKVFGAAAGAFALPALSYGSPQSGPPTHILLTMRSLPPDSFLDDLKDVTNYEIGAFPIVADPEIEYAEPRNFLSTLIAAQVLAQRHYPDEDFRVRRHCPIALRKIHDKSGGSAMMPFVSCPQTTRSGSLEPFLADSNYRPIDEPLATIFLSYDLCWQITVRKRTTLELMMSPWSAFRTNTLRLFSFDTRDSFARMTVNSEDLFVTLQVRDGKREIISRLNRISPFQKERRMDMNRRTALSLLGAAGAAFAVPALGATVGNVPGEPTHLFVSIGSVPGTDRKNLIFKDVTVPYEMNVYPVVMLGPHPTKADAYHDFLIRASLTAINQYPNSSAREQCPISIGRRHNDQGHSCLMQFLSPGYHTEEEVALVKISHDKGWQVHLQKRHVAEMCLETKPSFLAPRINLWDFDKREIFCTVEPQSRDRFVAVTMNGQRIVEHV